MRIRTRRERRRMRGERENKAKGGRGTLRREGKSRTREAGRVY